MAGNLSLSPPLLLSLSLSLSLTGKFQNGIRVVQIAAILHRVVCYMLLAQKHRGNRLEVV